MLINISCSDDNWVYTKFLGEIKRYSKHDIVVNNHSVYADVCHLLPYYENLFRAAKTTAWISHVETDNVFLYKKIHNVVKKSDYLISHSKKYTEYFCNLNPNIIQVMPGVDEDFCYRDKKHLGEKMIVGFVGRHYSSNRKNKQLLDKIQKLDFIELRCTNGVVDRKDMPEFYQNLDVLVSPSLIEGGPMSIQEALACGKQIICYEGVGVANEFLCGVHRVRYNDENAFINCLSDIFNNKSYIGANHIEMRNQILTQTWGNFVKQHDAVWDSCF